jgi:hypothetical protein
MSVKKLNAMIAFLERYGIIISWIARNLGRSTRMLDYWLSNGFPPEEEQKLLTLFHERGKALERFTLSAGNNRHDLTTLRHQFGIKSMWLAKQLNVYHEFFFAAANRQNGFTDDEREVITLALNDVARAFRGFQLPESLRKAA